MTTATLVRGLEAPAAAEMDSGSRNATHGARDGSASEAPVVSSPMPGPVVNRPSVGEYFGNFMRAVLPPLMGSLPHRRCSSSCSN